jgi:ABC-type nitrate/sulfonate/bicarbonate transport system permease component
MLTKSFRSNTIRINLSLFAILLFVYILLFEFILPTNKILPKPTILLESVKALFIDYNFLEVLLSTFAAIYSVMILSYFLIKFAASLFISIINILPGVKELFFIGKYFIPVFLIFLFEHWFGSLIWGQYLFILILLMGFLKYGFVIAISEIKAEYILSARSIGLSENQIAKNVIWKSIQPKIYKSLTDNHIAIWGIVIVYEFICKTDGIGTIFFHSLRFNDISVTIVLIILILFLLLIMEFVLSYIKEKYFFWD